MQFVKLMESLEDSTELRQYRGLTLLEAAKGPSVTLLLKVVEAIEAVHKMDSRTILAYNYGNLPFYCLFKREHFMTATWIAEQWLVCLSICLAFCVRRFPTSPDFVQKYNWLQIHGTRSSLSSLVNAVALISGGQALRTPRLEPI